MPNKSEPSLIKVAIADVSHNVFSLPVLPVFRISQTRKVSVLLWTINKFYII